MSKNCIALTLLIAASLGCSPSPPDASSAPDTSSRDLAIDEGAEIPLSVADTSKPEAVVAAFLDALRAGDNKTAEALLTTIARRETKEHNMPVKAPGSPSARCEIGEVKHVQGGVHVNSTWREYDQSGEQLTFEIVWVLRHEPIGWRVAGMATALAPDQPPIYLNFEDVPDMIAKWQQADDELNADSRHAESLQATQPGTTLQR